MVAATIAVLSPPRPGGGSGPGRARTGTSTGSCMHWGAVRCGPAIEADDSNRVAAEGLALPFPRCPRRHRPPSPRRSSAPGTGPGSPSFDQVMGRRSCSSMGRPPITPRSGSSDRCLACRSRSHAIDRRGRGASGDAEGPYSIEREFEDVAAVAETLAAVVRRPVDVFGHSYGGRCALGAALLTDAIRRVISYEGAPTPPGSSYHPTGIEDRLRERLAAGDRDGALSLFLSEVVGMSALDLAAYQADPIWPTRAAAAGTILRELEAEADPAASLDRPWAPSASRSCNSSAARACRSSATRPSRSTTAGRRPHRRHRRRPPRGPPHASDRSSRRSGVPGPDAC